MTLTQTILLGSGIAASIFGAGFALGRHSVAPPIPVQVAHGQTQIRETEHAHMDSVLRRQNDSLSHRLAESAHENIGVYAALDRIKQRLSHSESRADSLAIIAADTVPDSVIVMRPDTDIDHVKRDLAACDLLRVSCQAFRDSTHAYVASTNALIAAKDHELQAWRKSQPSKFKQLATYTLVAAAGFSLGKAGISVPFLH